MNFISIDCLVELHMDEFACGNISDLHHWHLWLSSTCVVYL